MDIIKHLVDSTQGKHPITTRRSDQWPIARKKFLVENPTCAVCGGKDNLDVHHMKPFHLHPELELDPTNFITLCESKKWGINCHLLIGHLGNFKSFNVDVIQDSQTWNKKLLNRPKNSKED